VRRKARLILSALANPPERHQLPSMSAYPTLESLLRLPPAERIQLIEDAWESLTASPESVPVPDSHRDLLDERLVDPTEIGTHTWDEVKDRARRSAQ
jgi:putative addiction module component (TIGR02574 family)